MTEHAYQVACIPGPNAAAGMTRLSNGAPVLVIYLDPVNMTIHGPPTRAGVREVANFCRELSREAARLAVALDPAGEAAPPDPQVSRHAFGRNEFGDPGAGH